MTELTLYGLKTCSTCRKALAALDAAGTPARLHDWRKDGADADALGALIAAVPWQELVNRRGTTWRGLSPQEQKLDDAADALALMLAHPAVIKRPVLRRGDAWALCGGDVLACAAGLPSTER